MWASTVGIFVFDQVEVLDFAGPYEVFTTAARVHSRSHQAEPALFRVCLIGESRNGVDARAGLRVTPDYGLADHPPLDVLVIPGGVVTEVIERTEVVRWIAAVNAVTKLTVSVCTGAFLLAKAGLLRGKVATTHWEDIGDLQSAFPEVSVKPGVRWVDVGHIVTSAGISAGIDMSLHVVERLAGRDLAERTARQMEFDWTHNAQ